MSNWKWNGSNWISASKETVPWMVKPPDVDQRLHGGTELQGVAGDGEVALEPQVERVLGVPRTIAIRVRTAGNASGSGL